MTADNLDGIKQLIANLFKLSENNNSPAEAASALAKATELLHKYQLERWQIDQHKPEGKREADDIVRMDWMFEEPCMAEKLMIAHTITVANAGRTVRTHDTDHKAGPYNTTAFIAQKSNAIISLRMTLWVTQELERMCAADYKLYRGMGVNKRKYFSDYFRAANNVIATRLKAEAAARRQDEQSTALVVYNDKAVAAKQLAEFPRLTKGRSVSFNTESAGARDGRIAGGNVSFAAARQVGGGARRLK